MDSHSEQRSRRVLGHFLRVLGAALLALAAVAAFWMQHASSAQDNPWTSIRILTWLVPVLLGAGTLLYRRGRKLLSLSAEQLLAQDTRPPVLYLRSFRDDPIVAEPLVMSYSNTPVSEEECVATVMTQVGPFVAIGRPGEALPDLGAARMYVTNEEWQQKVGELLSRSRLAVLRAGATPGFWWEVARSSSHLRPVQLLFLLPFDGPDDYEPFRRQAETCLPCKLPDYPIRPRLFGGKPYARVQSILHFDPDWTAHVSLLRTTGASGEPSEHFSRALESAMTPVARNLGVAWNRPLARSYRRSNWIAGVILAAVITALLALALSD